jgi:hypothetical protein
MSYCVNCGVELSDTEKQCPLCGVAVYNPLKQDGAEPEKCYPKRVERIDNAAVRKFWVKVVSILLAVPSLICVVSNLLYEGYLSWSFYAVGGILVLWAFGVSPFLFRKKAAVKWILIDIAALSSYLYLISYASSGTWFFPVAFPIVLTAGLLVLLFTTFVQRGFFKGLYIVSAIFFAIGLFLVAVEVLMDYYLFASIHVVWSWFALISCVGIALMFIFIERNKRIKEELKRKLHI